MANMMETFGEVLNRLMANPEDEGSGAVYGRSMDMIKRDARMLKLGVGASVAMSAVALLTAISAKVAPSIFVVR